MTATITRPKPKKSAAPSKQESPYKKLHVIIPIEDMLWASQQKSSVTQLWQECWTADPYGSRWMAFSTGLGYSTFIAAKKVLSDSGLFIFKPDKSIQDGRETVGWTVKNLHGSRIKEFWEGIDSASQKQDAEKQAPNSENTEMDAGSEEIHALYRASISGQNQAEQAFQKPSRTAQKLLTNSSKEIVRSDSSTQKENSLFVETAIAPFRGASPQSVERVSELEEELAVVTDCTSLCSRSVPQGEAAPTLMLVDAAQGESALLKGENQVSGVEVKTVYEVESSAPPVSNPEKWSHEAIVARSNLRPKRMQKLKFAANSGQNPGFDLLEQWWNDDPALVIMIKKLLVKYPQWGVACINEVLVDWEE